VASFFLDHPVYVRSQRSKLTLFTLMTLLTVNRWENSGILSQYEKRHSLMWEVPRARGKGKTELPLLSSRCTIKSRSWHVSPRGHSHMSECVFWHWLTRVVTGNLAECHPIWISAPSPPLSHHFYACVLPVATPPPSNLSWLGTGTNAGLYTHCLGFLNNMITYLKNCSIVS